MHKQTHAIASFETNEDARAAGYTTKITPEEAAHLSGMNRHERRAELARMRREARRARARR